MTPICPFCTAPLRWKDRVWCDRCKQWITHGFDATNQEEQNDA
jgi:hypothetical protein